MRKLEVFSRKYSSTILTVVGAGGVIATAIMAVKATPKALLLLEEAKKEKGDELTIIETVKAAWKPYIPAVISGTATITCIFGANILNTRNQASLMSAYALLDNSYREYREKVKELYEKEADSNVKKELVRYKLEDLDIDDEKELFFDFQSMRFFESTFEDVIQAEHIFNQNLSMSGYACLNEYYDILGIPRVDYGYQLGWSLYTCPESPTEGVNGFNELEFEYEKAEIDDGDNVLECWTITMPYPPTLDYIY